MRKRLLNLFIAILDILIASSLIAMICLSGSIFFSMTFAFESTIMQIDSPMHFFWKHYRNEIQVVSLFVLGISLAVFTINAKLNMLLKAKETD
jgi:hypothetical protein